MSKESLLRKFGADGRLTFYIRDRLDHPFYSWPRTLLSYPVQFEDTSVKPGDLRLIRTDTGESIPFQLSGVETEGQNLAFAFVNFFSDLPSGASRTFELCSSDTEVVEEPQVSESVEGNSIILYSGAIKVRIPASHEVGNRVPGPIMQVSRGHRSTGKQEDTSGGEWFGASRIVDTGCRVRSITTRRLESGPLFITYRITYDFEQDGRYTATIRCVSGLDFVYFYEEMEGLEKKEGVYLETTWTGFHPTHRQAPNHPWGGSALRADPQIRKGHSRFNWETIDNDLVDSHHGILPGMTTEGELSFRLAPYQPWGAYVMLTSANFWDERTDDSIGLFIDKVEKWQDHEYAIWSSGDMLQVRYYYKDGLLSWMWPLVTGTRSTCIACYDHQKDIEVVEKLENMSDNPIKKDGVAYRASLQPFSYTLHLQNWYGTLDLNMIKDWILEYPDHMKRPSAVFQEGFIQSADELERRVFASFMSNLALYGTRQNAGFGPVASRSIYGWFVDGYNRLYENMSERQRQRITAMYLFTAYIHAEEAYMPMKTMISGHPNFLSDVKSVPALMAFLFPEHLMAKEWADEFEKFCELNTRYHTRPAVPDWESRGGRWTENLGTYVWAFLRPAKRAEFALRSLIEKNRFAMPQFAELGDWMVNSLSAPFNGENARFYKDAQGRLPKHCWGMVTPENGPRRLHPPQGAHSARRMPPRSMWLLGKDMMRYRPLLAEYMIWAARPGDDDSEHLKDEVNAWEIMYDTRDTNRGTNPHLRSSKYTGYGIILRSNVDTLQEVSLHLQQIDAGPNYRWGIAGESGCGVIYYYAAGKSYSHNGREDVGDRRVQDTDFCSNFGVWKDGRFKAIGRNVLSRPVYDLEELQFAELLPRKGSYSWPEYQSRSVILVGSDYFVTYDAVFSDSIAHRFSWFTHIGDDLPFIHIVKGRDEKTELNTREVKGIWYDGMGDCMAIISHRDNVAVETKPFGCLVETENGVDYIFRGQREIDQTDGEIRFKGTAGVARIRKNGSRELALLHGGLIGTQDLSLAVDDPYLAISVRFNQPEELTGIYSGRNGGKLSLEFHQGVPEDLSFYVDGQRIESVVHGKALTVELPAGRHKWQLTAELPVPIAPVMLHTENFSGGAKVFWSTSHAASSYRVEISRDNGEAWEEAGTSTKSDFTLTGLDNGSKIHVRAVASNDLHESKPADEYPIYVTDKPPLPPDGLKLVSGKGTVHLTWGEVLGVTEYRVYRRKRGNREFIRIFSGMAQEYMDNVQGVIPAFAEPGVAANMLYKGDPYTVYEYAVSAVNGNGEGRKCGAVDTDPASWVNWDPKPEERFRRRLTYEAYPYREKDATPERYPYPRFSTP